MPEKTAKGILSPGIVLSALNTRDFREEMNQAKARLDAAAKEASALHEAEVQREVNLLIALYEYLSDEAQDRFVEWVCENGEEEETSPC